MCSLGIVTQERGIFFILGSFFKNLILMFSVLYYIHWFHLFHSVYIYVNLNEKCISGCESLLHTIGLLGKYIPHANFTQRGKIVPHTVTATVCRTLIRKSGSTDMSLSFEVFSNGLYIQFVHAQESCSCSGKCTQARSGTTILTSTPHFYTLYFPGIHHLKSVPSDLIKWRCVLFPSL